MMKEKLIMCTFQLSRELKKQALETAKAEHITLSALIRQGIELRMSLIEVTKKTPLMSKAQFEKWLEKKEGH